MKSSKSNTPPLLDEIIKIVSKKSKKFRGGSAPPNPPVSYKEIFFIYNNYAAVGIFHDCNILKENHVFVVGPPELTESDFPIFKLHYVSA